MNKFASKAHTFKKVLKEHRLSGDARAYSAVCRHTSLTLEDEMKFKHNPEDYVELWESEGILMKMALDYYDSKKPTYDAVDNYLYPVLNNIVQEYLVTPVKRQSVQEKMEERFSRR